MLARILIVMALLLFQIPAFAQSQKDLMEGACWDYKQADAHLNQVYQAVMKRHKSDSQLTGKIKTAQQAWLKYRDAHLSAIYPGLDSRKSRRKQGSAQNMCICLQLAQMTRQRAAALEGWLSTQEGDVCAGSRLAP